MPLMMLLAVYDIDARGKWHKITTVMLYLIFYFLDLVNVMESLLVLSRPQGANTNAVASHYSNTNASGIV